MAKQANGMGANNRPQVSADDAAFIAECLIWNKQSYSERSQQYREIDGYDVEIYHPTLQRMNKCIDLMKRISRT